MLKRFRRFGEGSLSIKDAMAKQSAGLLIYHTIHHEIQVLLVHPGGPFWAKKDTGAWSIPKGEFNEDEDPLHAAIRETKEETGLAVSGDFKKLTPVKLKSGKWIHSFMVEAEYDLDGFESNLFEMEWPPKSGVKVSFPEADKISWFTIQQALDKIHQGQAPILHEFERLVRNQ